MGGKIKTSELGEVLRSLGQVLTEKEVGDLKKEVGGDLFSWDKLKELAGRKPRDAEKQSKALLQAFQVFDNTGAGQINMDDFKHIVTSLGEKLSAQEFNDICKAAGLPTSGSLEYRQVVEKVVAA